MVDYGKARLACVADVARVLNRLRPAGDLPQCAGLVHPNPQTRTTKPAPFKSKHTLNLKP